MPDNERTQQLIKYMKDHEINISFVVYWTPSMKDQVKRVKRKLKSAGIGPTIQRIYYALTHLRSDKLKQASNDQKTTGYRQYFVPHHNSLECQQILKEEKVDVLLLATDTIISSKVFRIPQLATLNAHPGWVPQFRGLGSLFFQIEKGRLPAVSVHQIDEGIDTGPLFLREYVKVDPKKGLQHILEEVTAAQWKQMANVVRMLERGEVRYVETFNEPSNITRGMPLRRKRKLDQRLKANKLILSPFS